jgi:poly-gamma-glutamate synthesis protein (capsule biosynthesis protein)
MSSHGKKKIILAVAGQNANAQQKQTVHYFTQDGIKYAFLAYTTYTNSTPPTPYGVNMYSRDFASSQIAEAKSSGVQFIIASMRWGTEYSQGVNAYQKEEAQFLADNGVALVLGHGPHVLEPVQWLTGVGGQKTLVWYSLGNFLHAQLEPETLFNGIASIKIDKKTATITDIGFLPTYMHYDWTAQQAAAQDLLARRNFELVTLEDAAPLFAKSQLKTTIAEQTSRLQSTLNTYTSVKLITSKDL